MEVFTFLYRNKNQYNRIHSETLQSIGTVNKTISISRNTEMLKILKKEKEKKREILKTYLITV